MANAQHELLPSKPSKPKDNTTLLKTPMSTPEVEPIGSRCNLNINIPAILKYGSLACGSAITFAGLAVCLNVFNAFHVPLFVFGFSSVFFGFLIAQTAFPLAICSKWFPFVTPYKGRGVFMIYVGLGLFYDPFGFIEIVGIFTVGLGVLFLMVGCGCAGKDLREGNGEGELNVPKGAMKATQV